MVGHVLKCWPRHYLQQVAIERLHGREAVGRDGGGTIRMDVIQVDASSQDQPKFLECATTGSSARPIRRQITREDVRCNSWNKHEKIAAGEVRVLIDDRWLVTLEEGLPPGAYCVALEVVWQPLQSPTAFTI
jgi:hypothetical protein